MNFTVRLSDSMNPQTFLNRCGYATFRDPHTGQTSFVRRLGSYFYPRFHVYVQDADGTAMTLSLHLDMKQPTYQRGHAHSGEYDGEHVQQESDRIRALAYTSR